MSDIIMCPFVCFLQRCHLHIYKCPLMWLFCLLGSGVVGCLFFKQNMFFFEKNKGVKQPGGLKLTYRKSLLLEGFRCLCLGEW